MTAYTSIEELNAELLGAQAASNWDVLGGHVLATALKRSRVGGARAIAEQVEDDLHSFAVELASIGVAGETLPDLDINIPHHFADYLLDCLIIDWKPTERSERRAYPRSDGADPRNRRAPGDESEKASGRIEGTRSTPNHALAHMTTWRRIAGSYPSPYMGRERPLARICPPGR